MADTFQIINDVYDLEQCSHCVSYDFICRIGSNRIICAKCEIFHKYMPQKALSQAELVGEMFNFAENHGE